MTTTAPAITLDAKTHVYTCNGRKLASVGSLVKRVTPQFDAQFHAQRKAEQLGMTKEAVLAQWAKKRDAACDTGHQLHEFVQRVLSGQPPEEREQGDKVPEKCRRWLEWWEKSKAYLTPVKVEEIVGSERLCCAGTLDLLAKSSKTDQMLVMDWKQSARFDYDNRFGEMMLEPFDDLPNCERSRYSLQVSIYRLLAEEETGQKIGDSWILHVTDDTAEPHRAMDLRRRALEWVEGLKL